MMKSWRYLNERTVEIPEHYYDWMAPRWYVGIVIMAYCLMIWIFWNLIP